MEAILKTLKVRVKDKHSAVLRQWAFECNQVWNEANAITADYGYVPVPGVGWMRNQFSAFDLQKQLKGISQARGFPALTNGSGSDCRPRQIPKAVQDRQATLACIRRQPPFPRLGSVQIWCGNLEERAGVPQQTPLQGVG